ncbi:MAG: hypothetical protein AB7U79_00150 [Candidatus Izemoplasmatales bacterium]
MDQQSKKITKLFLIFFFIIAPIFTYLTYVVTGSTISPDTSIFYSVNDLKDIVSIYGSNGAIFYLFSRLTFDLMFPFVYFAFLWMLTRKLATKTYQPLIKKILILGVVFDFLENISVSIVLLSHPLASDTLYIVAMIASMTKWILLIVSLGIILLTYLIRRMRYGK